MSRFRQALNIFVYLGKFTNYSLTQLFLGLGFGFPKTRKLFQKYYCKGKSLDYMSICNAPASTISPGILSTQENKFVNSDGQWLLSFSKILSKLVTFVFQGLVQCAAKQPLTK